MITYWLRFTLESDTTFGRGDGIPGLIDQEVTLDAIGCPYLHGRTLKGLLDEVCADILFALNDSTDVWSLAADRLFGQPGSEHKMRGKLHVGHAQLPVRLRHAIQEELAKSKTDAWTRDDVVYALTAVRQQTAVEAETGAPDPHTLRTVRVILRKTPFEAQLSLASDLDDHEKGLLAACVKGLRRAGTARNRGRGRLSARIETEDGVLVSDDWYKTYFKSEAKLKSEREHNF